MRLQLANGKWIDTSKGIDISLAAEHGEGHVKAWWVDDVKIEPVMTDQFIGDVNQGGAVNFNNVRLNPHGNCTHTECVGHISKERYSINECLREFHFFAKLITVKPKEIDQEINGVKDKVITKEMLAQEVINMHQAKALIIRTSPNHEEKRRKDYSASNPPYMTADAMRYVNALEVHHLLIDLPSVDRESDGGAVECHHIFWDYPQNPQVHKTITEVIYADNTISDGDYFLNIQIMSIENDAAPSKIVLYEILES